MSLSSAVEFLALLLLGPHETIIVAAVSVFCQCNLNTRDRTPAYRTLFSMASIAITVEGAGLTLAGPRLAGAGDADPDAAGACRRGDGLLPRSTRPRGGGDCAVLARSRAPGLAQQLPVERAQLLRQLRRRGGDGALVKQTGYWLAPLTLAPLYLTYRSYKIYMGRIENEQQQVKQTADLHLATVEALARAIDAKDQSAYTPYLARAAARRAARAGDWSQRSGHPGHQDRGAAARHRQARRARAHSLQAGTADEGRVREDPQPPAGGRRDHRRGAVPVSGGADHPQPPRAMGRRRLSARASRRGDSARRPHSDDRRLLRRGHDRAAVSQGAEPGRARSNCCARKPARRSTRVW